MQEQIISSSSKLLIKKITNLNSGSLKLIVSCQAPYTLQATGSSHRNQLEECKSHACASITFKISIIELKNYL